MSTPRKQLGTTIHLRAPLSQLVTKRKPEQEGLPLVEEGQQRWGQPCLLWEGKFQSVGAATEKALSHVRTKCTCEGGRAERKGPPVDLNMQAGS